MEKSSKVFVGMDVHKESIDITLAEQGGEVRRLGVIGGDRGSLLKMVRKLRSRGQELVFVWIGGVMYRYRYKNRAETGYQSRSPKVKVQKSRKRGALLIGQQSVQAIASPDHFRGSSVRRNRGSGKSVTGNPRNRILVVAGDDQHPRHLRILAADGLFPGHRRFHRGLEQVSADQAA